MDVKTLSFEQSRRNFLSKILPASALCLGCGNLLSCARSEEKPAVSEEKPAVPTAQHKFLENSGMSFQQVFDFAFKEFYIPIIMSLEKEIGKDEFIETLKRASSEVGAQWGRNIVKILQKNDMASLVAWIKEGGSYKHFQTYEIVEETDKTFEVKVSECLFAKTFREADAADIGYAAICYSEYAWEYAFNPKIKFIRPNTLMQGDDYCNARWVLEA